MIHNIAHVIHAAEAGGKEIMKYFGKRIDVEEKTHCSDFRTKADTESEKAIVRILCAQFPRYNILSEELGMIDNKSEFTFIIDPLDGSNNFVLGIPNFSVSIGLMRHTEVIAGVVHVPILNNTYCAQKGKGAFLKGKKLAVNNESDIQKATIAYTCGYNPSPESTKRLNKKINQLNIKRYLSNWSPAFEYCLLASGKIEAIINYKNEVYDFIAGKIIAKEAGALITDFSGLAEKEDKSDVFIASNNTQIHTLLVKAVCAH